jgi:sulfite reductase (NADPH) hemoprotein beta-component
MTDTLIPPVKPSKNEQLKESDPTLAGTIAATLRDATTDRFSADDTQFLKFHGIYQQDDRDLRKIAKTFIFMVRCRIPGGVLAPEQYLACDELATRYGNATLRVTSRQGLQFHGTVKSGLGPLVKSIHDTLLTTLAACGDVCRNVVAPAIPPQDELAEQVVTHARAVASALAPTTGAYHAIWVDGAPLTLDEPPLEKPEDPLYGKTYLPRKFKLAFAIPPRNDVDIFTNCCGFIAVPDDSGALAGYVVTAGGGMGRTHGKAETFPRLADVIGFLAPEHVVEVAKGVLTIHRDFGDRGNRKHARLKYVLEDRGARWFREELERRVGFALTEAPPIRFTEQSDPVDWHAHADGRLFLGVFVEAGRIRDGERVRLKTALREVIERFRPEVRLTPGNNVILAGIEAAFRDEINDVFARHGVTIGRQGSVLRRASMACVALPTCGQAVAEAERYLPSLVLRIEKALADSGLGRQEIVIRMTGCPNGCARPYTAEIGFVGRSLGLYEIWLGGNATGTRLNRLYKDNVKDVDIVGELRPAQEGRAPGGARRAWVHRRDRRRPPRRRSHAREGALLLSQERAHGMGRVRPAPRAVGPVQDGLCARDAHPGAPPPPLDRAQRLGIHRARGHPGDPALLRRRQRPALPQPRVPPVHVPDRVRRGDGGRHHRGAASDEDVRARRPRAGPRDRRGLRGAAARWVHVNR